MTVATGVQCRGEAMAQVMTSFAQFGPKGTAAGNSTDLSEERMLAETISFNGTCWAAGKHLFHGRAGTRGVFALPSRPKRLAC